MTILKRGLLTCALLLSFAATTAQEPATVGGQSDIFIIKFSEPSLAMYDGGINNLRGTSRASTGARKLDVKTATSKAYLDHLSQLHQDRLQAFSQLLNRDVTPIFTYTMAANGMALRLTREEAIKLTQLDVIKSIARDVNYEMTTDRGPTFLGADTVWDGTNMPANVANQGEGIIIGVIDSGLNFDHPSFSDMPEDAYDYAAANPYGAGNFVGWCDPGNPDFNPALVCNNKHVGGWDFSDALSGGTETDGPEDSNGHGTHTASTAGGNFMTAPPGGFINTANGAVFDAPSMSGVAPHAHIINYDVCIDSCPGSAIIAAINQGVADGADVLSFSISGGLQPWADNDRTFLDAFAAGLVVVASAGNTRPDNTDPVGDVNHRGPWLLSVANSTHDRVNSNDVSVTGPGTPPASLMNLYGLLGTGPAFGGDVNADVTYAGDVDPVNFEGCTAWPGGNEFTGAVALISRGSCSFADKINNATAAGAIATVVFNNAANIPIVMGGIEATTIPSVMLGMADGNAVVAEIQSNDPVATTLEILGTPIYKFVTAAGNNLSGGSLIGPNTFFDVTKPDINGPGTNIFAAYADNLGAPPQLTFLSGTSMSAPHVAGAAALVIAAHPTWSPAEVMSAMMMTADSNTFKADAATPADPDDVGSGTVDLRVAALAGLTLDESFANFLAADPNMGGDPSTLNLASMRSNDCQGRCTWTRTFTNRLSTPATWNFALNAPATLDFQSFPTSITLGPNESASVQFCVNVVSTDAAIQFGEVIATEQGAQAPDSRLTLAVVTGSVSSSNEPCEPALFEDGFES